MKKFTALLLVLVMALSMAACSSTNDDNNTTTQTPENTTVSDETTGAPDDATAPGEDVDAGSLEDICNAIFEANPVEFMLMPMALDLTDTSDEGLWQLTSCTGLENADLITEAVVAEPMIGSIPFSLVLVRVADEANTKTVAETMKQNINPRKWICVEADDQQVSGKGDVVMFVMIGSDYGTAQSFTDAFAGVVGELEFTI